MIDLSLAELQKILRSDSPSFVERSFLALYPQVEFRDNWHLELICAKLDVLAASKSGGLS